MSQVGFAVDEIFDLLQDLRWHDVHEVAKIMPAPIPKAKEILTFLGRFNFIEYDGKKARIDRARLEWLRATESSKMKTAGGV